MSRTVRELDLSRNRLGRKNICKDLQRVLDSKTHDLRELSIASNPLIRDRGVSVLIQSLSVSQTLQRLNLSNVGMTDLSGELLAQALQSNKHLIDLDVSRNLLRDSAGNLIRLATGLHRLNLSGQELGRSKQSIESICRGLSENRTLLHLDISGCGLSEEDTHSIADSLKFNRTLLGIHLHGNRGHINTDPYVRSSVRFECEARVVFEREARVVFEREARESHVFIIHILMRFECVVRKCMRLELKCQLYHPTHGISLEILTLEYSKNAHSNTNARTQVRISLHTNKQNMREK